MTVYNTVAWCYNWW